MKRKLREAIENVAEVNNIKDQEFDDTSVSAAPISYADAVMKAREKKSSVEEVVSKKEEEASDALKKEISNDEHPEPLDNMKITLDESLFEAFTDADEDKFKKAIEAMKAYWRYELSLEKLHKTLLSIYNGDSKQAFEMFVMYGESARRHKDDEEMTEALHGFSEIEDFGKLCKQIGIKNMKDLKSFVTEYGEGKEIVPALKDYLKNELGDENFKAKNESLKEDLGDGWSEEADNETLFNELEKLMYEVRNARRGVYTRCKTYEELSDYVRRLSSELDDYADELQDIEDSVEEGLNEATVTRDFYEYKPWGQAVEVYDKIVDEDKLDELNNLIEEMYPEGINETDLNDLLAYESEWVGSMLNIPNLDVSEDEEED